jgi:hypothetical protein
VLSDLKTYILSNDVDPSIEHSLHFPINPFVEKLVNGQDMIPIIKKNVLKKCLLDMP